MSTINGLLIADFNTANKPAISANDLFLVEKQGNYYSYTLDEVKASLNIVSSTSLVSIESPSFAISSGDETRFGGYPKEDVFNENYSNFWVSALMGSALTNNAFIGQNFGSNRNLKGISIAQWGANDDDNDRMINTAAIQTSNDGITWFTQKTVNLSKIKGYEAFYKLNATASRVRVLATSSCSFGWHIYRIKVWS